MTILYCDGPFHILQYRRCLDDWVDIEVVESQMPHRQLNDFMHSFKHKHVGVTRKELSSVVCMADRLILSNRGKYEEWATITVSPQVRGNEKECT